MRSRDIGMDPEYQPSYIKDRVDSCRDKRDRKLRQICGDVQGWWDEINLRVG